MESLTIAEKLQNMLKRLIPGTAFPTKEFSALKVQCSKLLYIKGQWMHFTITFKNKLTICLKDECLELHRLI